MSIDLSKERPCSLTEAAKSLPNRPSVRTVFRWSKKGVGGVVLETVKLGHSRYTSYEALERFFGRITNATSGRQTSSSNSRDRQRRIAAAERELDQAGVR